jgi:hypothetical protein
MRRTRQLIVACAAGAALLLATTWVAGPAASAGVTATGYTIRWSNTGCELERLDLATGELFDLPAPPDPAACVLDLAASSEGRIYGVISTPRPSDGVPMLSLVTFAADGSTTVSGLPISSNGAPGPIGAIAMGEHGDLFVMGGYLWEPASALEPCTSTAFPYCLYTLDPTTGVVAPIGAEGGFMEAPRWEWLTRCGEMLYTSFLPQPIVALDPRTGRFVLPTIGGVVQPATRGYDCAENGTTLYALNGPIVDPGQIIPNPPPSPPTPDTPIRIGTFDLATNAFTPAADIRDPSANIYALAVVETPVPAPAPSTTTPAPTDQVSPAFTG